MDKWRSPRGQYILSLIVATLVSFGLFGYGALRNDSLGYSYLLWNLFLAWLPLLFAIRLTMILKHKLWSSWEAMGISVLWFVFLPNSFYMISDFIHIQEVKRVDLLYDTLMFTAFIYTGVVLGFTSLYLIHLQLTRRLSARASSAWIAVTLIACSFAVYVGRDLRWNSWDILVNPGGVLFDISDRLQHPTTYPQMLVTVIAFFILLCSMYNLMWHGAKLLRQSDD